MASSNGYALRYAPLAFDSSRRTEGTLSSPTFRGLSEVRLRKGDLIELAWSIPPLSNVTATIGNNTMEVDTQDGGVAYTTLTVTATKVRFFTISRLLAEVKALLDAQEITDGGSATYTCTYDIETDRVTIAKSAGAFGFEVTSGDLLSFLGFAAGAYTGAGTYTATGSCNMYNDVVGLSSNLFRLLSRGSVINPNLQPTSQAPNEVLDYLWVREAYAKDTGYSSEKTFRVMYDTDLTEVRFRLLYLSGTECEIRNPFTVILSIWSKD